MNILFDLDGTLVDASDRLYQLFQDLVPESNFSKKEYWELKRNKISHQMILERFFSEIDFEFFNKRWLDLIETDKYLMLDKVYPDTVETLKDLSRSYNLVLLTARQSAKKMICELDSLGIHNFFKCIIATEDRKKDELLYEAISKGDISKEPNDLFVSDMGKDIALGNDLCYRTVAITRGFMNEKYLSEYEPEYLIEDLNGLYDVINLLNN